MKTLNIYVGILDNFPDVEFNIKYPEILYPAWGFDSGFKEILKSLPQSANIITNSTDFLKFLSVQTKDYLKDTAIKVYSVEIDFDKGEVLSNKVVDYTPDISNLKMFMMTDYASWVFDKYLLKGGFFWG